MRPMQESDRPADSPGVASASPESELGTDRDRGAVRFASALKALTIYPADHPRVGDGVARFVEARPGLGAGRVELTFVREAVNVGGYALSIAHAALDWLTQRARTAGLHGVLLEPTCRPADVVAFGQALLDCRPGTRVGLADRWSRADASVRPIGLQVADRHGDGPVATAPPTVDGDSCGRALDDTIREALDEAARSDDVQELLEDIRALQEVHDDADSLQRDIDLLHTIGELLPADQDLTTLDTEVTRILEVVRGSLLRLSEPDAEVRDARLVGTAIQVARQYFSREVPVRDSDQPLPDGRPGDERYRASIEELLQEFDALPRCAGLRLPNADTFAPDGELAAHEVAGVLLHTLPADRSDERTSARRERLRSLLQAHEGIVLPLLHAHLRPGGRTLTGDQRLLLLETLLATDAGRAAARLQDYLNDTVLRESLLECLPIAAQLFETPEQFARLRSALAVADPADRPDALDAADAAGVFADPAVAVLLLKTGGPHATALLSRCPLEQGHMHEHLCDALRSLRLPRAERDALALLDRSQLPPTYLRALLEMAQRHEVDPRVRAETGERLRWHACAASRTAGVVDIERAIRALAEVPSPATRRLLQVLQRHRRWNFGARARAVRRTARNLLCAMETKR